MKLNKITKIMIPAMLATGVIATIGTTLSSCSQTQSNGSKTLDVSLKQYVDSVIKNTKHEKIAYLVNFDDQIKVTLSDLENFSIENGVIYFEGDKIEPQTLNLTITLNKIGFETKTLTLKLDVVENVSPEPELEDIPFEVESLRIDGAYDKSCVVATVKSTIAIDAIQIEEESQQNYFEFEWIDNKNINIVYKGNDEQPTPHYFKVLLKATGYKDTLCKNLILFNSVLVDDSSVVITTYANEFKYGEYLKIMPHVSGSLITHQTRFEILENGHGIDCEFNYDTHEFVIKNQNDSSENIKNTYQVIAIDLVTYQSYYSNNINVIFLHNDANIRLWCDTDRVSFGDSTNIKVKLGTSLPKNEMDMIEVDVYCNGALYKTHLPIKDDGLIEITNREPLTKSIINTYYVTFNYDYKSIKSNELKILFEDSTSAVNINTTKAVLLYGEESVISVNLKGVISQAHDLEFKFNTLKTDPVVTTDVLNPVINYNNNTIKITNKNPFNENLGYDCTVSVTSKETGETVTLQILTLNLLVNEISSEFSIQTPEQTRVLPDESAIVKLGYSGNLLLNDKKVILHEKLDNGVSNFKESKSAIVSSDLSTLTIKHTNSGLDDLNIIYSIEVVDTITKLSYYSESFRLTHCGIGNSGINFNKDDTSVKVAFKRTYQLKEEDVMSNLMELNVKDLQVDFATNGLNSLQTNHKYSLNELAQLYVIDKIHFGVQYSWCNMGLTEKQSNSSSLDFDNGWERIHKPFVNLSSNVDGDINQEMAGFYKKINSSHYGAKIILGDKRTTLLDKTFLQVNSDGTVYMETMGDLVLNVNAPNHDWKTESGEVAYRK